MVMFGLGCCRYDGFSGANSQNHGYKTKEECKWICLQDDTCMACDVARPNLQGPPTTFHCYTFHGDDINFHVSCGTTNPEEVCYKKQNSGI